jgi:hypothetical protein
MASVINQIKLGSIEYAIAASAYAECSTAAGTTAKIATICTDRDTTNKAFTLIKGVAINVKFTVTNTAASPTLNVNETGAKAIFYNGAAITAGYLKAGKVYQFVYNGTQWELVGDVDTDTNYRHTPSYTSTAPSSPTGGTSNLKIATGTGVNDLYVPVATASTAGVAIVYPSQSCTTFSSDSGTVTPLAVQKGAKMFAITRPPKKSSGDTTVTVNAIPRWEDTTGEIKNSKIIIEDVTNTKDTSKTANVLAIPAEGNKKMVYGYCTDQVDGTSFIGGVFPNDATEYPYASGLAIGGTSGNLLWKGKQVATTDMIPNASTSVKGIVQLTNSTASTSTTTAATPNSVKTAYDLAHTARTKADDALTLASAAMTKSNPTGVGTFSMNRAEDSAVGQFSSTLGLDCIASGYAAHAEGESCTAEGEDSHAEGRGTTALANCSHAEGASSTAHGVGSHAEGLGTNAHGEGAHTEGRETEAYGDYSHAEGYATIVDGFGAHAEGRATYAVDDHSHAEGFKTIASGGCSHAEGAGTIASGNYSHAEGCYIVESDGETVAMACDAAGVASHAEGVSWAVGDVSHAEGFGTIANGMYQHVQGAFNIEDNDEEFAHIVGNGFSASEDFADVVRSNAHTLDWNGTAWFAGDVFVGSTSGTHKDNGSKRLATEDFVTAAVAAGGGGSGSGSGGTVSGNYLPLSGGTMTGEIKLGQGDGKGIQIGKNGYINATTSDGSNTAATICGVANASRCIIGHGAFTLKTRGYTTRPLYNEKDLALLTDVPTTYAASSAKGGAATSANKLNTDAGNAYTPVYFANGIPVACRELVGENVEGKSYTINDENVTAGQWAEVFNGSSTAAGASSHAEGYFTTASGETSHSEGHFTIASGDFSHAENNQTVASGAGAHAEGQKTTASGLRSHAEGNSTTASGTQSHAEGNSTTASGACAHAEGDNTVASGVNSHAEGSYTTALNYQHAQGHYNNTTNATAGCNSGTGSGTAFVIGNGTSSAKSNAFRVDYNGKPYSKSALTTTGADYAEYFEWQDLNTSAEDRRGYFVTLDEDKIKIAGPNDYILGVVSGQPSVIGNGDEDWMGRYILDEFGAFIYEDFEYESEESVEVVNEETGEVTTEIKTVTKVGKKYKENPEYDPSQAYIQREDRPEWSAVGMVGVLSVRDDGTCKVNGYCKVADGGTATAADHGYRVIKRINDHIVKIVFK